ncbi:hypothetical protein [Spiroplasma endosymbiont of Dactylopius coccus]
MNISWKLLEIIIIALISGGSISVISPLILRKIKKIKHSKLAKELKKELEINYIIENIKQLNSHLQLETTDTAKLLDSFNISEEDIKKFAITQKAKRQELSEKDKKKVTKFKI